MHMEDCCKPKPPRYVPYFPGWTAFTPVVPQAYWNVYSAEERTLRISRLIDKIACYCDMLGDKISDNRADIDELIEEFADFKAHGFDDYYAAQVLQWISDNLEFIYENTIKQVYFGLTSDGYLVAYIPDSWDDIIFDTGYDYDDARTFGRLILYWDVDNAHPVDQS